MQQNHHHQQIEQILFQNEWWGRFNIFNSNINKQTGRSVTKQ